MCVQWVAKDPRFLHADSEDSNQTGRMPRLIRVFAGRTAILLVLSCHGSYVFSVLSHRNFRDKVSFLDIFSSFPLFSVSNFAVTLPFEFIFRKYVLPGLKKYLFSLHLL